MAASEDDYPDDDEAVPSLVEVKMSDGRTKRIVRKKISTGTFVCPECDVDGRKTPTGEKFCPECGLLLGDQTKLDRSPDSAGRSTESG